MATFHRDDGRVRMFVKGAPDVLLARCSALRKGERRSIRPAGSDRSNTRRLRTRVCVDF